MRLPAWRIANFFASNDKNFSVTPARGLARRDLVVGGPAGAGPKLRAHDLISEAHGLLQRVDAGPGNYFDTIAQRQLMKSIALRVNDAAMLALIEAWLEIAIEASDGNGKKPRSSNHC